MQLLLLGIGGLGTQELLIILAIVFVLFGASRLPQLAKALGQSKRAFREGIDEGEEEAKNKSAKRQERLAAADEDALDGAKSTESATVNKVRS